MPKGEYLQYGGQAIVEGVMMRSPHHFAVACRAPNGEIVLECEPLEKTWIGRQNWLKLPFLRGTFAILDAMTLGHKAMKFASHVQMAPEYQKPEEMKDGDQIPVQPEAVEKAPVAESTPTAEEQAALDKEAARQKKITNIAVGGALIFGLALGLFLFGFLPNLVAEQSRRIGITNGTTINFITEVIKVVFFIGYLWLISLMPEIRRLFQYHGAEHKAINALEADRPLNMEECQAQTRLHPRCGTSFAIIVLIVSMILFTFIPRYPIPNLPMILNVLVRFGMEVVILPVIAGISYEAIRFAGKFRNTAFVNFMFKPGLATQLITTKEPDAEHVEVALASLQACVDAEEADAKRKLELEAMPAAG